MFFREFFSKLIKLKNELEVINIKLTRNLLKKMIKRLRQFIRNSHINDIDNLKEIKKYFT